eukprot:TRINITY_DN13606_c0_g1_i1.p1 TRINITY_DN13606_c0_g1~~TRINITY_DN13606_c0_g1_i1.p1  ORF type:complete len:930 (+),score=235.17 TRINITY_DN13606_c0_g1_i1:101-2890(+)
MDPRAVCLGAAGSAAAVAVCISRCRSESGAVSWRDANQARIAREAALSGEIRELRARLRSHRDAACSMAETLKLMRVRLRIAQDQEAELLGDVQELRGEKRDAQHELGRLRVQLAERAAEAAAVARRAAGAGAELARVCADLAAEPCGGCGSRCNTGPVMRSLVRRGAWGALCHFLDSIPPQCPNAEAQHRCGSVERMVRFQVLGALAELGEDELIAELAGKVGSSAPLAGTVRAAEGKQRLPLLRPWMERAVCEGCGEPAVYTALAKVYGDSEPERCVQFLQGHRGRVDARAVGRHFADRNPRLALVAFASGGCDAEVLSLASQRGLVFELAAYLTRRSSAPLWEKAVGSNIGAEVVTAAVTQVLPDTQEQGHLAVAVRALAASGFGAARADLLAELALRNGLYEEAFEAYRSAGDTVKAMGVLLHPDRLVMAYDYATDAQSPALWRMLGTALQENGMTADAINCFTAAGDHGAAAALSVSSKDDGGMSQGAACAECSETDSSDEIAEEEEGEEDEAGEKEGEEEGDRRKEAYEEGEEEEAGGEEEEEEEEDQEEEDDEVDQLIDDLPEQLRRFAVRPETVRKEREPLAQGGFGLVWRGDMLGVTVAVKESKRPDDDEFLNEMLMLSELHHPNIVHFLGVLCARRPAIITEYCALGSLGRVLRQHARRARAGAERVVLTWGLKAGWLCSVGFALLYMHSKKVLHRDLKSTNVLLAANSPSSDPSEWTAKLADMGFACHTADYALSTALVGTKGFMAPEVIRDCQYSTVSDVYSLGCLGVEICSCRAPFAGAPSSVEDKIATGAANATMPTTVGGVALPGRLCGILLCTLFPDPRDRTPLDIFVESVQDDVEEHESEYAGEAPAEATPDEAVQYGWPADSPARERRPKRKKRRTPWGRWVLRKEREKARCRRAALRRAALGAADYASSG